jgi:hypothetical protein
MVKDCRANIMKRVLDLSTCRGNLLNIHYDPPLSPLHEGKVSKDIVDDSFIGFSLNSLVKDKAITTNPRKWKNKNTKQNDLNPEFLPIQHSILELISSNKLKKHYDNIYNGLTIEMFDLIFIEVCSLKIAKNWQETHKGESYTQKQFYTALDKIKTYTKDIPILWLTHVNLEVGEKIQNFLNEGNKYWIERTTSNRKLKSRDTIDEWMREYSDDVVYPKNILQNKTMDDVFSDSNSHYNIENKYLTERFYIQKIKNILI